MTGIDILKDVYALLYMDITGLDNAAKSTARAGINRILEDMGATKVISNLYEEITLPEKRYNALIYGTAMLIAAARGETERSVYFTELYNGCRAEALGSSHRRDDTLPVAFS